MRMSNGLSAKKPHKIMISFGTINQKSEKSVITGIGKICGYFPMPKTILFIWFFFKAKFSTAGSSSKIINIYWFFF